MRTPAADMPCMTQKWPPVRLPNPRCVGTTRNGKAAPVVGAVDQHAVNAALAQVAEGYLGGGDRSSPIDSGDPSRSEEKDP